MGVIHIKYKLSDLISDSLIQAANKLSPPYLQPLIGRASVNLTRDWMFKWDRTHPNKLGGKRTHIIAQAGKSAFFEWDDKGVDLYIEHESIRQRVFGGTIKPVNKKYLTIPAIAAAYGKKATEFSTLKVLFGHVAGGIGPVALYEPTKEKEGKQGRKANGEYKAKKLVSKKKIFYWLVKEVTQQGEPDIIPSDVQYANTALDVIKMKLDELFA